MSATPLQVLTRPFAIEPVTNIMLPDGIFDNAIYRLRIAAHISNMSTTALSNVTVYLESVGDPGIVPVAHTFFFASIPAGASMLVMWDCKGICRARAGVQVATATARNAAASLAWDRWCRPA